MDTTRPRRIEAVSPEQFETRERDLLQLAKQWMPKLPFAAADLLLIDQIGKNISGTGMDTNVVGRKHLAHRAADDEWPKIKQIAIRSLTAATHGNATGLGLAEFCRTSVLQQRDEHITRINCFTGGHAIGAMIPVALDSDREILATALGLIGLRRPPQAQVLWIRDTLNIAELACSEAYWQDAQSRDDLEVLSSPEPWPFDEQGQLPANVLEAWRN